jgi:hypothetical protein
MTANAYNPSYLGGKGREITCSRPTHAKGNSRLCLKNKRSENTALKWKNASFMYKALDSIASTTKKVQ